MCVVCVCIHHILLVVCLDWWPSNWPTNCKQNRYFLNRDRCCEHFIGSSSICHRNEFCFSLLFLLLHQFSPSFWGGWRPLSSSHWTWNISHGHGRQWVNRRTFAAQLFAYQRDRCNTHRESSVCQENVPFIIIYRCLVRWTSSALIECKQKRCYCTSVERIDIKCHLTSTKCECTISMRPLSYRRLNEPPMNNTCTYNRCWSSLLENGNMHLLNNYQYI